MQTMLQPNPRKTHSIRRLGTVDIGGIRDAIVGIPEQVWEAEDADKPNRFGALDRTRHIVFRFVSSLEDWRESYERQIWQQWRERLLPVLTQATRPYGYAHSAYPRIMLARMAPGGIIWPHQDANQAARWPHKIHIPILTNAKVAFMVGDTHYHFGEGEAVEVNNMGLHAVRNEGDSDRIHLIFEYYDLDQLVPEQS